MTRETFFSELKVFAAQVGLKIKDIALPLRLILTGSIESPDLGGVAVLLGKDEIISRIQNIKV